MAKRGTLNHFVTQHTDTSSRTKTRRPPRPDDHEKKTEEVKGIKLRLNLAAWRQIKIIALDQGRHANDCLIEALNDYFTKHNQPPCA